MTEQDTRTAPAGDLPEDQRGTAPGQWKTLREIADEIGTGKMNVYRYAKTAGLEGVTLPGAGNGQKRFSGTACRPSPTATTGTNAATGSTSRGDHPTGQAADTLATNIRQEMKKPPTRGKFSDRPGQTVRQTTKGLLFPIIAQFPGKCKPERNES